MKKELSIEQKLEQLEKIVEAQSEQIAKLSDAIETAFRYL